MDTETQSLGQSSKTHAASQNCLQDSQLKYILEEQCRDRAKEKRGAHFDSAYAHMEIKQSILKQKLYDCMGFITGIVIG